MVWQKGGIYLPCKWKGHPDKKKNNKVKTSPLPCSVFLCASRLVLKRKNVVWMHILIWTGKNKVRCWKSCLSYWYLPSAILLHIWLMLVNGWLDKAKFRETSRFQLQPISIHLALPLLRPPNKGIMMNCFPLPPSYYPALLNFFGFLNLPTRLFS